MNIEVINQININNKFKKNLKNLFLLFFIIKRRINFETFFILNLKSF